MRKMINLFGIVLILATGIVYAEAAFDFEELMEKIDTNSHNLQGNISNKDANSTVALAKQMQCDFKLVEDFRAGSQAPAWEPSLGSSSFPSMSHHARITSINPA